jgi:hypothetical protein
MGLSMLYSSKGKMDTFLKIEWSLWKSTFHPELGQTLHEIHSCNTCSFLIHRQSTFRTKDEVLLQLELKTNFVKEFWNKNIYSYVSIEFRNMVFY